MRLGGAPPGRKPISEQYSLAKILGIWALAAAPMGVLGWIIVRREEGDLRWVTLKRRVRLNTPRDPTTGEPRARLWLWVVPFLVAVAVVELVLNSPMENV